MLARRVIRGGLTAFILALLCLPTLASGDIIYSARYYYPPGVRATSHFHIYRIDPDGRHRRQLTFGASDDTNPLWSRDGRKILYLRTYPDGSTAAIILMDADGRHARRIASARDDTDLAWSTSTGQIQATVDLDSRWNEPVTRFYDEGGRLIRSVPYDEGATASPDGKHAFGCNKDGTEGVIWDSHGQIEATTPFYAPANAWASNAEVTVLRTVNYAGKYELIVYALDGHVVQRYALTEPQSAKRLPLADEFFGADFTVLAAYPGRPGEWLASQSWDLHGRLGVFVLNPKKHIFRLIGGSEFQAWSEDHHYACSAPFESITPYQKRQDGSWRTVYTSPLQIIDMDTGRIKTIQSGFMIVSTADWLQ